ncbi:MAG: filamentous hemagglutinin N-terminal domain-containing protein [Microcystaceae cyanobacterium]
MNAFSLHCPPARGATRGANLFHSFLEFNVGEGREVYFANPAGIENIMSRVTGGNASNILGRLGVLGGANLFLLNPNGILFGPNASLDIQGSFVGSTADGIQLGEDGFFSATEPHQSQLLSVDPGVLFYNQVANHPGSIINRGNLAVGKDLTLSAGNLDLQGQLFAGGNLTLQGLNAVQIRDSVANPFIAAARGSLLVQGNQTVDIFALSHPNSGLFSGGNMVLRSANTVSGDAHYWSGGSFRIEQLDGSLGGLFSPNDLVIRANGDVALNSYTGASLHILAGCKMMSTSAAL